MKKMILMAIAAIAMQSHAAQYKTCVDEVRKNCGSLEVLYAISSTSGEECSMVQSGTREEDGSRYAEKVIFKDAVSLYSIEMSRCGVTSIALQSPILETKQFAGRLFNRTASGSVIVIGRENSATILLNSKNKPYTTVKDFSVNENGLTLVFSQGGAPYTITLEKMLEKLNHPNARL